MRAPPLVCLCSFPGVFLSSRVTGAGPVTTDLIMRVNVRTKTTTTTMGVWTSGCVLCGWNDPMGSKIRGETFSTEFFDWRVQSKKSSFSTGSAGRNSQSKKVESKKPFFRLCKKALLFGILLSKTDFFDCQIGLLYRKWSEEKK